MSIRAVFAAEPGAGAAHVGELSEGDLGDGDVLVEVEYSSLNYKDALAITGEGRVVRRFPMVCGIDLAGRVRASDAESVPVGSDVLVTGCGLGEDHFGGYAKFARVQAGWCVSVPPPLNAREAMAIGTAGLTAMLSVLALERNGASPERLGGLPVLVTGAGGGVGSLAVALLSRLGYPVVASTGRPSLTDYLRELGAREVIGRDELSGESGPVGHVRFAGAVDVVGGRTLSGILATTRGHGTVAACGLAGGTELVTTVLPFILRGVTLAGINSVWPEPAVRAQAWERLAGVLSPDVLGKLSSVVGLEEVFTVAPKVLSGESRGRVVLDVGSF